jgi:hypothetical protein
MIGEVWLGLVVLAAKTCGRSSADGALVMRFYS